MTAKDDTEGRRLLVFIAALTVLRFVAGAVLPLSADEAYYWLWSKHLAAGYFDHPPAIAFLVRAGTMLFGDNAFGVRVVALLLSVAAGLFVWRAGALVLKDERAGALACLLFNLTLMTAVETMAATPDAPLITCAAALLYALAKLDDSGDGRWWLAVGAAGGAALLSKYTALFLAPGVLAWLVFVPRARPWLATAWLYLGVLLALAIFAPNLWWNASHGWMTFAFQFGRIEAGHFTLRFLAELLGAQLLLATPVIFACGVLGLANARRLPLPAALILPAAAFFLVHSLHDRVQGNWPSFLYPAFALAAAAALWRTDWTGAAAQIWLRRLTVPAASVILVLCYAQAFFAIAPLGRSDPISRLLGFGVPNVARQVEQLGSQTHAAAILTTDYASTGWFDFYGKLPAVQINEDQRWLAAPRASAELLRHPLLYVAEQRLDRHDLIAAAFTTVTPLAAIDRTRAGTAVAHYVVYRVSGFRGEPVGRVP